MELRTGTSDRIIKRHSFGALESAGLDTEFVAPERIFKATSVRSEERVADEEVFTRGILRGASASVGTRAYELRPLEMPTKPAPEPVRAEAPAAPEVRTKSADEIRADLESEWTRRMNAAVEAARAEGFASGVQETTVRYEAEIETLKCESAETALGLEAAFRAEIAALEPLLVELTFEIAETLLDGPVPEGTRAIAGRTLSEAVDAMAGSSPIDVSLHPVDFLRLQESGLVDQLTALHSGLRWEPSAERLAGEWVVHSPTAVIRRLQHELLATLRKRVGLSALPAAQETPTGALPATRA